MYKNAKTLLDSNNKLDYRYAYDDLNEIENINPNYKDVRKLMEVAHQKGTDYVLVDMINDSRKVIPERLESDLLNFSNYGSTTLLTDYIAKINGLKKTTFFKTIYLEEMSCYQD